LLNISVINSNVTGLNYVGAVVGWVINENSTEDSPIVSRVSANDTLVRGWVNVGGLIGITIGNITVQNSFFDGEIVATFSLGENTITIPPGSYDLNQLLTQIQSLLPNGSQIQYNDVLNLINITLPGPNSLDFSIGDIHILLGFLPQEYSVNTNFTSSFPPKIYSSVLLVKTNLGSNMVSDKGYTTTFIVPVNVNKSELLQFYNRSQFSIRPKVMNNDIKAIDIVLYDEYERPLIGCGDFVAIIAVNDKEIY
jgi:hypothetical protein